MDLFQRGAAIEALLQLDGHRHHIVEFGLGAFGIHREQETRQRQGAGRAGDAGLGGFDLGAQRLLAFAQAQNVIATSRTHRLGNLAHRQLGQHAVQLRSKLAVIDPAHVAIGGGAGMLAELARDHREGRALAQLHQDILGVVFDLAVLLGIVDGQEDFHHAVMRLVGAFGMAAHFGVDHFGRDVHAVAILVLHGLHPGDRGGDLRAQRLFAGAGGGQGLAQLLDGELVVRHHRIDALVDFGGADGDLLLHRFLKLELLRFQGFQNLRADALALFGGELLVDARRRQVQRDALAHFIV